MNLFDVQTKISKTQLDSSAQLFLILLFALILVLWVWSLTDALKRKDFKDGIEKLIWVFVIVSTFFLGTVLYYFIEIKPKKTKIKKETNK